MILTTCAACAAPLAHNAPRCVRCKVRYAQCLYRNADASRDDITAAIATLEELDRSITRIYGAAHPQTRGTRYLLEEARETLARAK